MSVNITDTGKKDSNNCATQNDDNDQPPLEPAHNDDPYLLPDYFDYRAYSSACLRPREYQLRTFRRLSQGFLQPTNRFCPPCSLNIEHQVR
jgi:hypothetical protein